MFSSNNEFYNLFWLVLKAFLSFSAEITKIFLRKFTFNFSLLLQCPTIMIFFFNIFLMTIHTDRREHFIITESFLTGKGVVVLNQHRSFIVMALIYLIILHLNLWTINDLLREYKSIHKSSEL